MCIFVLCVCAVQRDTISCRLQMCEDNINLIIYTPNNPFAISESIIIIVYLKRFNDLHRRKKKFSAHHACRSKADQHGTAQFIDLQLCFGVLEHKIYVYLLL